jgi:PAS domain S-box-containing protein
MAMTRSKGARDALQEELEVLRRRTAELEQAVAEQSQVERELRVQVLVYEQALDALPDMVLIKGEKSRIAFANRAFRDFYGMTMDQLRDLIDAPFNEPDYTQQYVKDDAQVYTTGQTLDIPSEPVTRYDGEVRLFHTVKSAIVDAAGEVIRTVGISCDITAEHEAAAAAQESEDFYRGLFNQLPLGLALSRMDGTLVDVNPAYAQIIGRSVAETLGLTYWQITPEKYADQEQLQVRHLTTIGRYGPYEKEYIHKDGQLVPVRLSGQIVERQGERFIWSSVEDISESKLAEDALRRSLMQDEIIRAQEAALAELSTPLIPFSDRVVVMPLVGAVDSRRAQQVIDTLLNGIALTRAQVVILDITGVAMVDTQVANGLLRAAQAVKLLGAQAVLTGIRPEVAQALVGLGVDLSGIVTRGTLQSGIAFAIGRN